MDINDYINGTPIEPGVTYKLGNADANSAWTLVSDRPCLFKLSATAPTDSAWSNVTEEQYIINGDVSNQVIEITSPNGKYFVVATHDQDSAATVESAYATVSLKPLGFNVEDSYETTPLSGDGPVTEGFYKISNLESGKLYSFNVTPDAGGLKATNPSPEYAFSLFSVDGSNNPKALLAVGITECPLVFVATESTAVLNLSSTLPDSEFFVCIRNFSLGSDGSGFDPSSDQSITGAWTFSNITLANEAPLVLGTGTEAVKISGSGTGSAVIEGGNDATLDVAVPVSLQEPTKVVQIKTDISGVTTDKTIIRFYQAATRLFQMYQYKSTGTLGFQPSDVGTGISVNAQGTCAMESSGIIRGPASFESGVTCSQSLTVAQIATFNGSVALGNSAKISGSVLEESDITDTTYIPVGNSNQRYIKYKELTKADYDALETKSNSTIYFLTDQTMWAIGTKKLVTSDMPS